MTVQAAEQGARDDCAGKHEMPPFPAFEASASYERYAEHGAFAHGGAQRLASAASEDGANGAQAAEDAAARTEEEALDAVLTCIGSQNALREVLYKTLVHCQKPRDFAEAEDFIAAQDEFVHSHIIQTPFALVQMLLRAGGLSQTPLDSEGNPVSDERCAGLTDDELDDLIATYELGTTPAGVRAVDLLSPERRLAAQLAQKPHRTETFYALMEFCTEPRTFPEIQEFFKTTPGLALDRVQIHHTLSPDFYVDRLDKAGVLVWQGAWKTNEVGRRALANHRAEQA